jgi:hypothetical protein
MSTYSQGDKTAIEQLLMGHTVTKVAKNALMLDDGRLLQFVGNEGGCACNGGDYDLTELNGVDNIITRVEFVDSPDSDYDDDRYDGGHYKIFVFANNEKINLATFEGTDGSGYYGTGYEIHVKGPEVAW